MKLRSEFPINITDTSQLIELWFAIVVPPQILSTRSLFSIYKTCSVKHIIYLNVNFWAWNFFSLVVFIAGNSRLSFDILSPTQLFHVALNKTQTSNELTCGCVEISLGPVQLSDDDRLLFRSRLVCNNLYTGGTHHWARERESKLIHLNSEYLGITWC